MITDALVHADQHLGISSAVENPEDYLYLTDDILRVIERSKAPELAKSREIMKRLRTRDLYKFVDEYLVPTELAAHINKVKMEMMISGLQVIKPHIYRTLSLQAKSCPTNRATRSLKKMMLSSIGSKSIMPWKIAILSILFDFTPNSMIQVFVDINNQVKIFLLTECTTESFTIPKQQVSYMIPTTFQEVAVRVFTRNPTKIIAIQKAFRCLMKKMLPADSFAEPNAALTLPSDYDTILLSKRKRTTSTQSLDRQDSIVNKWAREM